VRLRGVADPGDRGRPVHDAGRSQGVVGKIEGCVAELVRDDHALEGDALAGDVGADV
jgi:hypothetical protein